MIFKRVGFQIEIHIYVRGPTTPTRFQITGPIFIVFIFFGRFYDNISFQEPSPEMKNHEQWFIKYDSHIFFNFRFGIVLKLHLSIQKRRDKIFSIERFDFTTLLGFIDESEFVISANQR